MKVYTILKNIITRLKQGISQCLADAKDYTDALADEFIIYRDFTSASKTMSAGSATNVSISITVPNGYKYLCNVQTSVSGDIITSFPAPAGVVNNSITVYLFNNRSYGVTVTATVRVLFVKDMGG